MCLISFFVIDEIVNDFDLEFETQEYYIDKDFEYLIIRILIFIPKIIRMFARN